MEPPLSTYFGIHADRNHSASRVDSSQRPAGGKQRSADSRCLVHPFVRLALMVIAKDGSECWGKLVIESLRRNQAMTQLCAFSSPKTGSMSAIEIDVPIKTSLGLSPAMQDSFAVVYSTKSDNELLVLAADSCRNRK